MAKQVSINQALEILKSYKSTLVSVTYETDPKLLKGGRSGVPKREIEVVKQTSCVVLMGTKIDYETLVQNRLIKAADLVGMEAPEFTAEERKWGNRIDGVEVNHNGKVYVTMHFVMNNIPKSTYLEIGSRRVVEKSEIETWLPKSSSNDGKYRDCELANWKSFKVGGETY